MTVQKTIKFEKEIRGRGSPMENRLPHQLAAFISRLRSINRGKQKMKG